MLMGLRKSSETWLGRIVLGLVMGVISISFAIWGIGNIFHGFTRTTLATVGGSEVSVSTFRQAYQAHMERLRTQTRQPITNEQAHAAGIDRAVLTELMADAALTERVKSLRLALSGQQLREAMVSDDNFRGPNGVFDARRMSEWMQEHGYSQADLADVYMKRQISIAVAGGLSAPRLMLDVFHRYATETRSITYAPLPIAAAGEIPAPDNATLQKFYDGRKTGWRAPEYRSILVLALTQPTLAKPATVSDEDARKLYERVADGRFGKAERRTLQQLIFPTEAEAQAALAKIKAGKSFADVAKERNLSPGDVELGTRTKVQVADAADAAFALPKGGVSDPIKSRFGYVLVRVVEITPGSLRPFADVAAQLKAQIAISAVKASDIEDAHKAVEKLHDDGKSLTEVAKALGLTPRAIPAIDADGRDKAGVPVPDLFDGPNLLKAVFASGVGLENATLEAADRSGYAIFEVRGVEPARERSFAEIRPEVEKAWRTAEVGKILTAKVKDLYQKIDSGTPLETAIPGTEVKTATGLTREGKSELPEALVTEAFNTPVGMSGSIARQDGSRIVFKVTDTKAPPFDPNDSRLSQLSAVLGQALNNEVVRQYAARLESEVGSKIETQALQGAVEGGEPVAPPDLD